MATEKNPYFTEEEQETDPILFHLIPNAQLSWKLLSISNGIAQFASGVLSACPRNAERTAGLRKLLEAKDCFVRSAREDQS